ILLIKVLFIVTLLFLMITREALLICYSSIMKFCYYKNSNVTLLPRYLSKVNTFVQGTIPVWTLLLLQLNIDTPNFILSNSAIIYVWWINALTCCLSLGDYAVNRKKCFRVLKKY
ncbi:hypothetical protein A3Q56_04553, partial [Intoshia linei]